MPRACTVCSHESREAIDRSLVEGLSNLSISSLFDVSEAALRRHKAKHLPARLAKAQKAQEVARADDLLEEVRSLQIRALIILDRAESAGDLRTALGAIREARSNLELLAKLLGELNDNPQVSILINPEWVRIRTVLLGALSPYPEANSAVASALLKLEAG